MSELKVLLERTYTSEQASMVRRLRARFTALDEAECEDLVQFAFTQALVAIAPPKPDSATNEKPAFTLQRSGWGPWLWRTAVNAAISYLRRVEAMSLESLSAFSIGSDGVARDERPIADSRALTPSQLLAAEERTKRRRMLVSDLLRSFAARIEKYRNWRQCEVFERSLRGQPLVDISVEMGVPLQTLYEIRSRAFGWLREQIELHDGTGSILESAFGAVTTVRDAVESAGPRRIFDVVRWAVDQVGALCPSPRRLAAAGPDVQYHVHHASWYLLPADGHLPPAKPGCIQCRMRSEEAEKTTVEE